MDALADNLSARDRRSSSDQTISDSARLSAKYMEVTDAIARLQRDQSRWQGRLRELNDGTGTPNARAPDVNELNKELVALYGRKDALQNELSSLEAAIKDITAKKAKMEKDVDLLAETTGQLRESVVSLTAQRSELENTLDRVKKELAEASKQFMERTEQVEDLRSVVGSYKQRMQESAQYIQEAEKYATKHAMTSLLTTKNAHAGAIVDVAFGRSYGSLVTVGEDKKLFQWGLPGLNEIRMCQIGALPNALKVHNELGYACIAGRDRMMRIVNLELGKMLIEHKSHTQECTDVMWLSKNQVISASKDRTMKLFEVNRNEVVSTIMAMTAVNSICETSSPGVIAAGCFTGIRLFDTRTGKLEMQVNKVHGTKQITCIIPSTSKDSVYTIGTDGKVCETDLKAAVRVHQWGHDDLVVNNMLTKISVDPMGGYLAAGSDNGSVLLFDLYEHEKAPIVLKQHQAAVLSSVFAANMLVTVDKDHKMMFWV